MKIILEGKAKRLLSTKNKNEIIQHFTDNATAFNNKKHFLYKNKGVLNNHISSEIFQYMNKNNIKTHFIKKINEREQLVRKVNIIPIEFVIRNYIAGSLQKKFNLTKGDKIRRPIMELYLKSDALNDPFINEDHVYMLNLAKKNDMEKITKMAFKINKLLINFFLEIKIVLIDFKLEFGRLGNEILLADEISPDNCRLHDMVSKSSLDKDVFRENKGDLILAYKKVFNRIRRKSKGV